MRNTDGLIAVVRTPSGVFLPGGGLEQGEDPGQAVQREVAEECGFILKNVTQLGKAIEIVYSSDEGTCFEKVSTLFEAHLDRLVPRGEPDHELTWLTNSEAASMLTHASHRWAVQAYKTPARRDQ